MAFNFHFDPVDLPPECKELRQEVRAFLNEEIAAGTFSPHGGRNDNARAFARKVGERGWIGMTWPKQYGGHERRRYLCCGRAGLTVVRDAAGQQQPAGRWRNLCRGKQRAFP